MNVLKVFAHRPLVLPLAIGVAVAMVAISELAHWRSMSTLTALAVDLAGQDNPRLVAHRLDLEQSLMLGRIGVAVLSLISLVALFLVQRQALALQQQQLALQGAAQAENDTLEITVAQRTAQLIELTHHLQTAREDERSRLARDLHDELGALLTSAKLDAARIRSRLAGQAPEALERLAHLVAALDGVITLKRRITENLHPSSLTHLGLVATLQILADEFETASGTPVHCSLAPVHLTPAAELMVYRLVQESITNISKYAHARQVWLSLAELGGQVKLVVRDDGVGFDAAAQPRSAYGLVGMRYRVQAEHGRLKVQTAPGQGTCIEVELPAAAALAPLVAASDSGLSPQPVTAA